MSMGRSSVLTNLELRHVAESYGEIHCGIRKCS